MSATALYWPLLQKIITLKQITHKVGYKVVKITRAILLAFFSVTFKKIYKKPNRKLFQFVFRQTMFMLLKLDTNFHSY